MTATTRGSVDAVDDSSSSTPALSHARVGRFSITREIGAGAMGRVYEGWDEQLQRLVALKFSRPIAKSPASSHRFLREAQGLARLSHPNVAAVYDVGQHEGSVWMAMEYIHGQTLGEWIEAGPRGRAQILRCWLDAGRGLAAIHAAGLVHRDIKPTNVLLGDDGRVCIVDFGLVKSIDSPAPESCSRISTVDVKLAEDITARGAFVGTPAYAAPEQLERREVDARSDQFALCVSLWEALVGERPLRETRAPHKLVPLPAGKRLPRRLHRALSRGLSLDPQRRFTSVNELLAALEPPRRRWLTPSLTAGAGALVAVAVSLEPTPRGEPLDRCASASAPIDAVWTQDRRRAVAARLDPALAGSTEALLDGWVQSWSRSARTSCEGGHALELGSSAARDLRAACLEHDLDDFDGFLVAVEDGRVHSPHALTEWLGTLPEPSECLDASVLSRTYAPVPADQAERITRLRQRLIDAGVSSSGARIEDRIEVAEAVLDQALALDSKALAGQASLLLGRLQSRAREIGAARVAFGRAVDIGMAASDLELAADAWSGITWIETQVAFDAERAEWARVRQAALYAEHAPSPRRRARLLYDQALIFKLEERHEQGAAALREAIELYASVGLTAAWEQAAATRQLGNQLLLLGREVDALASFAAARDLELHLGERRESSRGEPQGMRAINEGIALVGAGRAEEARGPLERELERARAEWGPRSEMVARLHVVLAAACEALGDVEGVRHHAQRADEVSLIAVGSTSLLRVDVLSSVGALALADGRPVAAVSAFEQALIIARGTKNLDSLQVGLAERNLAVGLHAAGEDERAVRLAEHALALLERRLPSDDPQLAPALVTLGEIHRARGDEDEARAYLERAERVESSAR